MIEELYKHWISAHRQITYTYQDAGDNCLRSSAMLCPLIGVAKSAVLPSTVHEL